MATIRKVRDEKTLTAALAELHSGLDRTLKANTSRKRTHSLFRQGVYWYHTIPNMREDWFRDLMAAFDSIVAGHSVFTEIFGII